MSNMFTHVHFAIAVTSCIYAGHEYKIGAYKYNMARLDYIIFMKEFFFIIPHLTGDYSVDL